MIPDKLLINLKILSKIPKNGRISRSLDGIISLETDTIYQPFRRFLTSDSRKQSISEINSIINECIDTLSNIINLKWMNVKFFNTQEYHKGMENISLLINSLESAKIGIVNLKFTYQNDPNISCQIDIMILKVNSTLKEYKQKITIYTTELENSLDNDEIKKEFTKEDTKEESKDNISFDNFHEVKLNSNSVYYGNSIFNKYNDNDDILLQDPAELI